MEHRLHLQLAQQCGAKIRNKNCPNNTKNLGVAFMRNLESRNQQLATMLIEKINSATMQLNIIIAMLANRNMQRVTKDKQVDIEQVRDICVEGSAKPQKQNNIWQQQAKSNNQQESQKQELSSKISTQENSFSPQSTGSTFFSTLSSPQAQLLKLQTLNSTITSIQSKLGLQLIQHQIWLQQEHEQTQRLSMYQTRISDMLQLLIVKQNDMAMQHTGGIYQQKMKTKHFQQFQNQCVEIGNIKAMWAKVRQFRRQVKMMEAKLKNEHVFNQIENVDDHEKQMSYLQNARTYKGKQNILQIILNRQSQHQSKTTTFSDPFFRRIIRIVKKQISTQANLGKEYKDLAMKMKQIDRQHSWLTLSYKKATKIKSNL